ETAGDAVEQVTTGRPRLNGLHGFRALASHRDVTPGTRTRSSKTASDSNSAKPSTCCPLPRDLTSVPFLHTPLEKPSHPAAHRPWAVGKVLWNMPSAHDLDRSPSYRPAVTWQSAGPARGPADYSA